LAVCCALSFWTFWEVEERFYETLELNGFDSVYSFTEALVTRAELGDTSSDTITFERNLIVNIFNYIPYLDKENTEEKQLRDEISRLLDLDDFSFADDEAALKIRLKTIYTAETQAKLIPLYDKLGRHIADVRWETSARIQKLKAYLILFTAFLTLSLGTAIISFEVLRRKTSALSEPKTLL